MTTQFEDHKEPFYGYYESSQSMHMLAEKFDFRLDYTPFSVCEADIMIGMLENTYSSHTEEERKKLDETLISAVGFYMGEILIHTTTGAAWTPQQKIEKNGHDCDPFRMVENRIRFGKREMDLVDMIWYFRPMLLDDYDKLCQNLTAPFAVSLMEDHYSDQFLISRSAFQNTLSFLFTITGNCHNDDDLRNYRHILLDPTDYESDRERDRALSPFTKGAGWLRKLSKSCMYEGMKTGNYMKRDECMKMYDILEKAVDAPGKLPEVKQAVSQLYEMCQKLSDAEDGSDGIWISRVL